MRIMLDTNVLLSALMFPGEKMDAIMQTVFSKHTLVLSSFVVDELKAVVKKKFSNRAKTIDMLLSRMSFDFVYTPETMDRSLFRIRDPKDYPVLYTAVTEDVDILITGDKDFEAIEIDKPVIMTPSEFYETYVQI